ncbi:hypothetical protein IRP63_00255 [Clostridium botulinum]|uniref:Uncharacterized protein n=1 Tax=Clostridium botulinum C/D str. DC5 TaxID=1443128 RepID=A0A0A0IK09_CLOBO|nr:hypothetical protein [Clostridium botulinum]KEI04747.1 hypothetical protein Z952_06305 [Clostridium botulinum C/D str. BKT75002]KEI09216.1 hypothetical protein Z954_13265 [Clostridium botulinum C/D str. BKT2873]KGM93028.1 hypothetical protein Z956_12725 [Clostridium botulinum D str. CCUG 7971]KGN00622.1 hypothetical protein Z955_03165 [Clostridium botulinum C/D str. DC5]KOC46669.1 hypothetical protein ADU88_11725 [Clostridium botulinum]
MISSSMKMVVAQNCIGYDPKYTIALLSMVSSSESCSNCKNFIKGKCIKGLFDEVMDIISKN